jgi:cytochrome c553
MSSTRWILCAALGGALLPALATSQSKVPLSNRANGIRSEPVAETRLLMEAITQPNFKGLEKLLAKPPEDAAAWTFARGQALLIAETGNLLLLRPPKAQGQEAWNRGAVELREAGARLARAAAAQDYQASRERLGDVAAACNRCHQGFGAPIKLTPVAPEPMP